jgi:hypothetical protein
MKQDSSLPLIVTFVAMATRQALSNQSHAKKLAFFVAWDRQPLSEVLSSDPV